jgi:hypothetical protein
MPKSAERKIKRQGGVKKYRSFYKGGKLFRVAVTKKAGPRGGHSVAWEVPK